eukprot:COSAG05_NODE_730_length_7672_cov_341.864783_2_plen_123_part_00
MAAFIIVYSTAVHTRSPFGGGLVSAATPSGDSPPSHAPTRAGAGSTGARAALQGALPLRQLGRVALGQLWVLVLPPELRVARAAGHHLPQHRLLLLPSVILPIPLLCGFPVISHAKVIPCKN